jgi:hypothetical protein
MAMDRVRCGNAARLRPIMGMLMASQGLFAVAAAGEIEVEDGWKVASRSCAPAGTQESITYKPFAHR